MTQETDRLSLILPYGGGLVDLIARDDEREEVMRSTRAVPSVQLSPRALADLELLAVGAFSPLARFMGRDDYERVLEEMRLADGTLFPIPLTLPVGEIKGIKLDEELLLRSPQNELIAQMVVEEIYERDPEGAAGVWNARRAPSPRELGPWTLSSRNSYLDQTAEVCWFEVDRELVLKCGS